MFSLQKQISAAPYKKYISTAPPSVISYLMQLCANLLYTCKLKVSENVLECAAG